MSNDKDIADQTAELTYHVVSKLIGPIQPVGEAHTDERRYFNLQNMCELAERLVSNIAEVRASASHHQEHSIQFAAKRADDCLKEIKEML